MEIEHQQQGFIDTSVSSSVKLLFTVNQALFYVIVQSNTIIVLSM